MSAPYRHLHYGASSSRNHQWVRNDHDAAYDRTYDAYYNHQQQYAHPADYRDAYAYQPDHYAAYPSAYDAPAAYADAQRYKWRDVYGYGAAWRQDGYDAQSYHQHAAYDAPAARYDYEAAHARQHPMQPANQVANGVAAELKSVVGAPAAPKKMREAAAAAAASAEPQPWTPAAAYQPPHAYNYNSFHQQQQQQQRDYHSYASAGGAPSARYQPYARSAAASGSAPATPTQMNRPPPQQRAQPAAIRAAPRPNYLEQAKQTSRELTEDETRERKLLVVLDLNGTLVFRAKSGNGRAVDSVRAVPRPFLFSFLQYCLGLSTDAAAARGKAVDAAQRPHGSHFWHTDADHVYEPRSAGHVEVVVWSSAQPFNVDAMVRASFDGAVRAHILRVWARDTLVPLRFFQSKAESIKDLEIVWAELNAFAHGQPSPGRLMAQARDVADQARPDDVPPASAPTAPAADKKYRGKKHKDKMKQLKLNAKEAEERVSAALEAARMAEELGPWGAENTVLVDDSVAKARLQPYNHLLIPEFGKEDAGRMRNFIRQQLEGAEGGEGEAALEYDSDLSVADEAKVAKTVPAMKDGDATATSAITNDGGAASASAATNDVDTAATSIATTDADTVAASSTTTDVDAAMPADEPHPKLEQAAPTTELTADSATERKKKPIPESRLDDVLLQTIGVLETLRHQSNVSAFIYHGGIKGYGQPKTSLNEAQRAEHVAAGLTPEFWAEEGRKVCAKLGIEVKAWVPGAAASATAARL
ncbi:conserved hypothetical protein [Sporisorium reilianum SRZ2]|uniref:FCP1 homology domain-containing protein n=1 Tax=Sporisorium reilianum (strain SRZ2) TaxID=999809 RepID=E6ZQ46_SPORE|nr:conserved hypothetical protein [Sporisorium reilianum SRZ2]